MVNIKIRFVKKSATISRNFDSSSLIETLIIQKVT